MAGTVVLGGDAVDGRCAVDGRGGDGAGEAAAGGVPTVRAEWPGRVTAYAAPRLARRSRAASTAGHGLTGTKRLRGATGAPGSAGAA